MRIEQHFVFGVIKRMRKRSEFKISLSNLRGGKILNSTMSGGDSIDDGGRGSGGRREVF